MAWKPGAKKKQEAGCLIVFGGIFGLVGAGMLIAGCYAILRDGFGAIDEDHIIPTVLGFIFLLIGFGIAIGGYKTRNKATQIPEMGAHRHWRENDYYPKPPKITQGNRGVRLQATATPLAKAIGLMIVALFWNGIVGGISIGVFQDGFQIIPAIFFGIFGIVGLLIFLAAIHQLLRYFLVGNTYLEVSRIYINPGQESSVAVYQQGNFKITEVTVTLVCQEKVSYRRGTDTVTETNDFFTQKVLHQRDLQARGNAPTIEGRFFIPGDAMHSFKAGNNEINWFLRVVMDIPGKPDVKDEFILLVTPEV